MVNIIFRQALLLQNKSCLESHPRGGTLVHPWGGILVIYGPRNVSKAGFLTRDGPFQVSRVRPFPWM